MNQLEGVPTVSKREREKIRRRIEAFYDYKPASVTPAFPKTVLVELSNVCNHRCVFCAYAKMTRAGKLLDFALLERLLQEAYELGGREVGFYAGAEPFTSPDLERGIKLAKMLGYGYVFISTNASLATEARLRACMDHGLDSLKFSINAGDRETYRRIHGRDDFDKVIERVKFCRAYRDRLGTDLYLAVSCVLVEHAIGSNAGSREQLPRLLGSVVDEVIFYEANNQNGQMLGLAEAGITAPCPLPFMQCHISAEGYLRMCCSDYQNYLSLVDLNRTTLKDAWEAKIFQEMRRRHLENALEGTLCHNCIHNTNAPMEPVVPELAVRVGQGFFQADGPAGLRKP
ncbi:MAG: radical SAM protein [Candidatus Omnitrophica bacterium]|nr:radical SAM protein [Candidatus Omnitrophota bacterium]